MFEQTQYEEGLIRPTKRKTDPAVAPDVLMTLIPADVEYLSKLNQAGLRASIDQVFFQIHLFQNQGRTPITLCGPFLGAPQAVMGMEKLIALGGRRIWVFGWCGSIQPGVNIGDFLLPTDAYSEEGTSQHYPIGTSRPCTDPDMTRFIGEELNKEGHAFHSGTVWTTDAPYRETPAKILEYREKGALAVEMEMSALITLSAYRSVRVAGLLVVSDELGDLKWRPGFKDPRFKAMSRFAADWLFRLIESRIEPERNSP